MHHKARNIIGLVGVAIALAVIAELFVRSFRPALPNVPMMDFQSTSHDAGIVTEAKPIEHSFAFKNTGGALLRIGQIKTSCGCTIAEMSSKEFLPGESGTLKAKMKFAAIGVSSQRIIVQTNASSDPVILTMRVDHRPQAHAVVAPKKLVLPRKQDASAKLQVEVFTLTPPAFEVEATPSVARMVEAKVLSQQLRNLMASPGYYRTSLELDVRADQLPAKAEAHKLTLQFRPQIMAPLEIPLEFEEIVPWVCRPSKAFFVFPAAGETFIEQKLTIESSQLRAFTITRITNPLSEWLEVTSQPGLAGKAIQLDLKAKRRPREARLDGSIQVTLKPTDGPEQVLTIPVSLRTLR